jgi:IclR family transcriptional regulator, pca regulon regulatory protein
MKDAATNRSDPYVRSLARGLSVIRSFTSESSHQTLTQVAANARLDRAGARRMLSTLESLGYVRRQKREFYLTPRVLDLGYTYLSTMPLWNIAEPVMEELVNAVHESSSASVLDGAEIVYVVRVPVQKIMTINLAIGSRLPAYCTSMGRVLLGGLSAKDLHSALTTSKLTKHTRYTLTSLSKLKRQIAHDAQQGWSLVKEELEEGLCSISVPIFDSSNGIIAAMNVTGNLSRTTPAKMVSTALPHLQQAAEKINKLIRYQRQGVRDTSGRWTASPRQVRD